MKARWPTMAPSDTSVRTPIGQQIGQTCPYARLFTCRVCSVAKHDPLANVLASRRSWFQLNSCWLVIVGADVGLPRGLTGLTNFDTKHLKIITDHGAKIVSNQVT
jgi:hypothetical protein